MTLKCKKFKTKEKIRKYQTDENVKETVKFNAKESYITQNNEQRKLKRENLKID